MLPQLSHKSSPVFQPEPPQIEIPYYQLHKPYSATVKLKNTSANASRLHVVPCKQPHWKIIHQKKVSSFYFLIYSFLFTIIHRRVPYSQACSKK